MAAENNQFFPSAEQSWLNPWASCWQQGKTDYDYCSQYLTDEYSVTHFDHGFVLLYWMFAVPLRLYRDRNAPDGGWDTLRTTDDVELGGADEAGWCELEPGTWPTNTPFDWLGFYLVFLIEVVWEIFENSKAVIEAFRQQPNSAEYAGDSGLNMLGDVLLCMLGYALIEKIMSRLGWKRTLAFTVVYAALMTLILYLWICDGIAMIWVNAARPGTIAC